MNGSYELTFIMFFKMSDVADLTLNTGIIVIVSHRPLWSQLLVESGRSCYAFFIALVRRFVDLIIECQMDVEKALALECC